MEADISRIDSEMVRQSSSISIASGLVTGGGSAKATRASVGEIFLYLSGLVSDQKSPMVGLKLESDPPSSIRWCHDDSVSVTSEDGAAGGRLTTVGEDVGTAPGSSICAQGARLGGDPLPDAERVGTTGLGCDPRPEGELRELITIKLKGT